GPPLAFAQYVRQDGTAPLTSNWSSGGFAINSLNSLDIVNPVAFGADPTGTLDSRAAIQGAINYAQGRPVVLPAGRFLINGPLIYSPPQSVPLGPALILRGARRYATLLDSRVADGSLLSIQ